MSQPRRSSSFNPAVAAVLTLFAGGAAKAQAPAAAPATSPSAAASKFDTVTDDMKAIVATIQELPKTERMRDGLVRGVMTPACVETKDRSTGAFTIPVCNKRPARTPDEAIDNAVAMTMDIGGLGVAMAAQKRASGDDAGADEAMSTTISNLKVFGDNIKAVLGASGSGSASAPTP